jgi:hypothetical protein
MMLYLIFEMKDFNVIEPKDKFIIKTHRQNFKYDPKHGEKNKDGYFVGYINKAHSCMQLKRGKLHLSKGKKKDMTISTRSQSFYSGPSH